MDDSSGGTFFRKVFIISLFLAAGHNGLPINHHQHQQRQKRSALDEVDWEYGGWRPIMPGSPFYFVKRRASSSRNLNPDHEGSASGTAISVLSAPFGNGTRDLTASASSSGGGAVIDGRAVNLPHIDIPEMGCCHFQPVLYMKHHPDVLAAVASERHEQTLRPGQKKPKKRPYATTSTTTTPFPAIDLSQVTTSLPTDDEKLEDSANLELLRNSSKSSGHSSRQLIFHPPTPMIRKPSTPKIINQPSPDGFEPLPMPQLPINEQQKHPFVEPPVQQALIPPPIYAGPPAPHILEQMILDMAAQGKLPPNLPPHLAMIVGQVLEGKSLTFPARDPNMIGNSPQKPFGVKKDVLETYGQEAPIFPAESNVQAQHEIPIDTPIMEKPPLINGEGAEFDKSTKIDATKGDVAPAEDINIKIFTSPQDDPHHEEPVHEDHIHIINHHIHHDSHPPPSHDSHLTIEADIGAASSQRNLVNKSAPQFLDQINGQDVQKLSSPNNDIRDDFEQKRPSQEDYNDVDLRPVFRPEDHPYYKNHKLDDSITTSTTDPPTDVEYVDEGEEEGVTITSVSSDEAPNLEGEDENQLTSTIASTASAGAIHFQPIRPSNSTGNETIDEDDPQLYHAYYAPAAHDPPPGYVRMTVEEFNKLFKDAEIQFIGSEQDLTNKLGMKNDNSTKQAFSDDSWNTDNSTTIKINAISDKNSMAVFSSPAPAYQPSESDIDPRDADKAKSR